MAIFCGLPPTSGFELRDVIFWPFVLECWRAILDFRTFDPYSAPYRTNFEIPSEQWVLELWPLLTYQILRKSHLGKSDFPNGPPAHPVEKNGYEEFSLKRHSHLSESDSTFFAPLSKSYSPISDFREIWRLRTTQNSKTFSSDGV